MNHKGELMNGTKLTGIVAGAVLAAAIGSSAVAQQRPGYGPAPGYGHGPGMMGGYSPGDGYGRGMMDGYGPGGGHGGYGAGPGLAALNLTDEQREKIARIQEDTRSKNWNTMGQMRGEMFKLRQMYFGDKLDSNAISEQQRKVDELRRQMLKARVETRNQVAAVLTPEQRQQFRSFGPWWAPETE
jgi:Spy/CpxP family protein refolding chaperone